MNEKKRKFYNNILDEYPINYDFDTSESQAFLDKFYGKEKTTNEINFYFRKKKYGWLSNFEGALQIIHGDIYPTNEHFYQCMKAKNLEVLEWIKSAPSPYLAMKAGRSLRKNKELVENWDKLKVHIMYEGLKAKFSQNEDLKEKLLATGDAILHEDSPSDMFWGKKGKDWLGKLLMRVRKELKKEANKSEKT